MTENNKGHNGGNRAALNTTASQNFKATNSGVPMEIHAKNHEPEWAEPILFDSQNTPEILANLLPASIGNYVEELANHTETPPILAVMVALAVLSTATRGRIRVQLRDGHEEPVNIFTVVAMESGNRKSSVFSELSKPLSAWERVKSDAMKYQIAKLTSKRKSEEAFIEQRRRNLHKKEEAERNKEIAEITEAENQMTEIPASPKLYLNDATPESLAAALEEQGSVLSILSDEGGIFDVLAGMYANGTANVDVLLKGWDGGDCRIKRKDREIQIKPLLKIGLTVQPATLRNFAGKRSFQGRGLPERFLFAMPRSNLGFRSHDKRAPSTSATNAYLQTIKRILDDERPRVLTLAEEAETLLHQFRLKIEKMLRCGEKLHEFSGWGSKLPGQLYRLAGLVHVAEIPESNTISIGTIERVIYLGELLIEHALAAFDEMGIDQENVDARRCWSWISQRNSFTGGELTKAMRHHAKANRISVALANLHARNLIDSPTGTVVPGTRGKTFKVNPHVR